jgi:hypothetical protein
MAEAIEPLFEGQEFFDASKQDNSPRGNASIAYGISVMFFKGEEVVYVLDPSQALASRWDAIVKLVKEELWKITYDAESYADGQPNDFPERVAPLRKDIEKLSYKATPVEGKQRGWRLQFSVRPRDLWSKHKMYPQW